jgi:hypothetical protein
MPIFSPLYNGSKNWLKAKESPDSQRENGMGHPDTLGQTLILRQLTELMEKAGDVGFYVRSTQACCNFDHGCACTIEGFASQHANTIGTDLCSPA